LTNILSAYHSKKDEHYYVIAIACDAWFIYGARFNKSNTARNLAKSVHDAGRINEERWIRK